MIGFIASNKLLCGLQTVALRTNRKATQNMGFTQNRSTISENSIVSANAALQKAPKRYGRYQKNTLNLLYE